MTNQNENEEVIILEDGDIEKACHYIHIRQEITVGNGN